MNVLFQVIYSTSLTINVSVLIQLKNEFSYWRIFIVQTNLTLLYSHSHPHPHSHSYTHCHSLHSVHCYFGLMIVFELRRVHRPLKNILFGEFHSFHSTISAPNQALVMSSIQAMVSIDLETKRIKSARMRKEINQTVKE